MWAEAKKEEVEQYKLRVLSRRNATLAPSKLVPIEEVPEPERSTLYSKVGQNLYLTAIPGAESQVTP